MKTLTFIFCMTIAAAYWLCNETSTSTKQSVNPIIGDKSFVAKFGYEPDANTDNHLRVQTHLAYVENLLREKKVEHLSQAQQAKRNRLLDLLHDYWTKGVFPQNYDYPNERKPCFIDKDNTICAVGYLVEQTAGREAAEYINQKYKYSEVMAMNDEIVDNWVANSGLTKEECAMIQPQYTITNNYISPKYGFSSALLGGVNLSLNTINATQMMRNSGNNIVPIVGLVTGISQFAIGTANFIKSDVNNGLYRTINESQKILSIANIGLGTSTIMLSSWNLIENRKPQNKRTTWNLEAYQRQDKQFAMNFNLTHKF